MLFVVLGLFFFFKQKTAYEMRISDWSSDVCSSDLYGAFMLEVLDHALVVHDFVSHVDGRAVFLQRQFDDVDGAHYTGAEPSGTGQDHSHSVCLPGRDRADRARPPSRATSPPFDRDPCRVSVKPVITVASHIVNRAGPTRAASTRATGADPDKTVTAKIGRAHV